jgi:hypothetical protein
MQTCDQTCSHCARDWFRWLKAREGQMGKPHKGAKTTWSEAAATSVRPVSPAVGARVQVKSLSCKHTAVVLFNSGCAGGDGRHWVQVAVTGFDLWGQPNTGAPWCVHVDRRDLVEEVCSRFV